MCKLIYGHADFPNLPTALLTHSPLYYSSVDHCGVLLATPDLVVYPTLRLKEGISS